MFTDQVIIEIRAGKGGNGVVAWRREKYLPKGGPYGGDGGRGGSIIIQVDPQIPSLDAFRNRRLLKAENGQQGGSNNRRGRNGKDLILKVPCGTLVKDSATGEILRDLTESGDSWAICQGGRGGKGNTHFKSPTNRAPNTCTPGRGGHTKKIEFELKLIADVGLVGFPNAGKSTLVRTATSVPIKVGAYPFTTLRPNLGYLIFEHGERILMADIPGIIEGAHRNKGLGHEFLRHVERTKVLLYVIDGAGEDPLKDFETLRRELELYDPALLDKPSVIVLNKIDLNQEQVTFPSELPQFPISALTGEGLDALIAHFRKLIVSDYTQ